MPRKPPAIQIKGLKIVLPASVSEETLTKANKIVAQSRKQKINERTVKRTEKKRILLWQKVMERLPQGETEFFGSQDNIYYVRKSGNNLTIYKKQYPFTTPSGKKTLVKDDAEILNALIAFAKKNEIPGLNYFYRLPKK